MPMFTVVLVKIAKSKRSLCAHCGGICKMVFIIRYYSSMTRKDTLAHGTRIHL